MRDSQNTLNFEKDRTICHIIGEIKRNQADLNIFETSFEVYPHSSCTIVYSFHKFISIPPLSLPQSENIPATSGRLVENICMSDYSDRLVNKALLSIYNSI